MIRYASQSPHKIRSTTSVNLNVVTDDQIKGLLTSNLDALHISIDGVTQEVYEKYRVGGNLETVFNSLKKLVSTKKLYKSKTKIIWDFIVMRQNEHQVEEAKKIAKGFGVPINIDCVRTNLKDDYLNPVEKIIGKYSEWLPNDPQYNSYDMDTKTRKKILEFCKKPWQEVMVNWNGDVFPCSCVHTEEKDRMGNIFEQEFKDIWNGKKYIAAKKELLDQSNDLETICHACKKNGHYTI
mgnify:CR=1 FL=1